MIHFDKHLLSKDKHFYLGFSGGQDSLGAALFLKAGGYDFTLLHVRHFVSLSSQLILDGVQLAADKLELPLAVHSGHNINDTTVRELAYTDNPTEMEARTIRNHVFNSLRDPVVVAHTLNDLAETYFQNCLKGCPQHTPLYATNGKIIRPFLRTLRVSFMGRIQSDGFGLSIVPDKMQNQRQHLREYIFLALNTDLTLVARRLFIDTRKIYELPVN